jgi:hypothetical protein
LTPLRGRRRDGWGEKSGKCTIDHVKALLAFVAGGLGLRALLLRRRRHAALDSGPSPADELREKIAESRAAPEPQAEVETTADEPEVPGSDPQSRRRDVHDRAREAIDELG